MENIKIKNNINKLIIDSVRPDQLENLEELQARFDARQSFYKKAYIGTFNGCKYLKSYNTIVACIFQNQLRIYGGFSQTTARHINEFFNMYNIKSKSKKELEEIGEKQIYFYL